MVAGHTPPAPTFHPPKGAKTSARKSANKERHWKLRDAPERARDNLFRSNTTPWKPPSECVEEACAYKNRCFYPISAASLKDFRDDIEDGAMARSEDTASQNGYSWAVPGRKLGGVTV